MTRAFWYLNVLCVHFFFITRTIFANEKFCGCSFNLALAYTLSITWAWNFMKKTVHPEPYSASPDLTPDAVLSPNIVPGRVV